MPAPVTFFTIPPLYERLYQGELILTSNERLASRIRSAYVVHTQQSGTQAITTPRVFSLNNWIGQLWEDLLAVAYTPALQQRFLDSHQELLLWERIISESEGGQVLMRPAATAQQAAAAYRLLADWQLDIADPGLHAQFQLNDDTQAWFDWAQQMIGYCQQHQLQLPCAMATQVLQAAKQQVIAQEDRITLIGFQDVTPRHQQLLHQLGKTVEHYVADNAEAEVKLVQCESSEHEIQAAAIWAKQILKQDVNARVAIVVPELSQQRANVERLLLEVFEPGYNYTLVTTPLTESGSDEPTVKQTAVRRAPPFNLSAGYALLDAPVINIALELLQLLKPVIELETVEAILHSPFHCLSSEDGECVAQLLRLCRDANSYQLTSARLRQWAVKISQQQFGDEGQWFFAEVLLELQTQSRASSISRLRSYDQWATLFTESLALLGWPGSRRLDSIEYQQVSQWQSAIKDYSELAAVAGESVDLTQALSQLRAVLARLVFQPQTADSPLQVLGLLEAAGLEFSHLWLTSMSSQSWPPAPAPNPFIPVSLQREQGMPHASAQREYHYAKQLSEQFIHSAAHVVISSPETVDDNPSHISNLFSRFVQQDLSKVLGRPWQQLLPEREIRRRYQEAKLLESVAAENAPALTPDQEIRGGVSIFSDQSACPFRAFAKHRLHTHELGQPEIGLNAAERGMLLHRALELLWNALQSLRQLQALTDDELEQRCEQAAQYALDQLLAQSVKDFGQRFIQIENRRLKQLLFAWMQLEKGRDEFTVIATEQRRKFVIAGLPVDTRIDRIDQLADGGLLIMDYKTGSCAPSQWWSDRPEQPQLPLYIQVVEEGDGQPVAGIAFGQISAKDQSFKAVGDDESAEALLQWDGKTQTASGQLSWQQQKQRWQQVLANLAEDFVTGKADVDPKYHPQLSPKTCQYCELKSVCRISHQELAV